VPAAAAYYWHFAAPPRSGAPPRTKKISKVRALIYFTTQFTTQCHSREHF
jgi:hypothetical protein